MIIDLFSGIGGLSSGFHRAGFKIKVAIEKDPEHASIYALNYPQAKVINRSIRDVSAAEIIELAETSEIQVVIGGPPCQGYSLQGRQDINDPRCLLIWDFAEKVSLLRPKYFVMETVPGIIMPKFQKTFDLLLEKFASIGYKTSWRKLNAAEYGTPQNRQRILILGTLVGNKLPSIPQPQAHGVTVRDAIADLPEVDNFAELLEGDTVNYEILGYPSEYVQKLNQMMGNLKIITGMQRTAHTPEVRERFSATLPGKMEPISRFKRLDWQGVSNTLKASYDPLHGRHTPCRPIHPLGKRCITVREAARLHGYPDNYRFSKTKTKAYQQIGNSVPPPLSFAVAEAIARANFS